MDLGRGREVFDNNLEGALLYADLVLGRKQLIAETRQWRRLAAAIGRIIGLEEEQPRRSGGNGAPRRISPTRSASILEHEVERLVDAGMTADDARTAAHRRFGCLDPHARAIPRRADDHLAGAVRTGSPRRLVRTVAEPDVCRHHRADVRGRHEPRNGGVRHFRCGTCSAPSPFVTRRISTRSAGDRRQSVDPRSARRDYEEIRTRSDLFDGVVGEATARRISAEGQQLLVGFVTGEYFETLGPRVLLGRALTAGDARTPRRGARRRAHRSGLGAPLRPRSVSSRPRARGERPQAALIVGVLAGFGGLDDLPRDVWVPITMVDTLAGGDLSGSKQPRQLRRPPGCAPA